MVVCHPAHSSSSLLWWTGDTTYFAHHSSGDGSGDDAGSSWMEPGSSLTMTSFVLMRASWTGFGFFDSRKH
jgi:hypothetical protein